MRETEVIKCLEQSSLVACPCQVFFYSAVLDPITAIFLPARCFHSCGSLGKMTPALQVTRWEFGDEFHNEAQISVRGLEECLIQVENQERFLMNYAGFHCSLLSFHRG